MKPWVEGVRKLCLNVDESYPVRPGWTAMSAVTDAMYNWDGKEWVPDRYCPLCGAEPEAFHRCDTNPARGKLVHWEN